MPGRAYEGRPNLWGAPVAKGAAKVNVALAAASRYMTVMPSWLAPLAIVVATIALMEGFAWFAHKYIMHGFGWGWHRSHHEPRDGRFEKNDLYAVVFGSVAIALFAVGWWVEPLWWVALGITGYGLIYAFVHDMLVHQRGGFRWVPKRGYFKRLLQAHRLHHAVRGRDGGVSFGFLVAPEPTRLKRELAQRGQAR